MKTWQKCLLGLSLSLNVLGFVATVRTASRYGGVVAYAKLKGGVAKPRPKVAPSKEPRLADLAKLPVDSRSVVFAGDSIAWLGPWSDVFGTVKNRGVDGSTVGDLAARIGPVIAARPRSIVLMVGTNDLGKGRTPDQAAADYRSLLGRIRRESPETEVLVVGVLPVRHDRPRTPKQTNAEIAALNGRLRAASEDLGATFVDPGPVLRDTEGNLRADCTDDGLHPNIDGYLRLCEVIRSFVEVTAH